MKIVDRQTFLGMPAGTIYAKFDPHSIREPAIKGQTIGSDWVVQSLTPYFEGADDDGAYFYIIDAMMAGKESPPVDYDFNGRDGLFDQEQLFAVWSADDVRRLMTALRDAIALAYPEVLK